MNIYCLLTEFFIKGENSSPVYFHSSDTGPIYGGGATDRGAGVYEMGVSGRTWPRAGIDVDGDGRVGGRVVR